MATVQLLQIPVKTKEALWQDTFEYLLQSLNIANGTTATLWAPKHEDNKVGGIVVAWKSLDAQKAWAESPQGKQVKAEIDDLPTGSAYEDIVVFADDPIPTFSAKAVELVSWIHPVKNIDEAKKEKVEFGFKQFQKAISSQAPESDGGLVAGWGQVEFEHKGERSRRFTALIGWKSVDAHYACKSTPVFTDNFHWLMENNHTGIEMVHYHF